MPMTPRDYRTAGGYLIVILAMLKLLVVPLNSAVKTKKTVLDEYQTTYATRALAVQKQNAVRVETTAVEDEQMLAALHRKDSPLPVIQVETVKALIKNAEKNGLQLVNFEFPDAVTGKTITDIPVTVRVRGMPKGLIDFLKDVKKMDNLIDIKSMETTKTGNEFAFNLTLVTYRTEQ